MASAWTFDATTAAEISTDVEAVGGSAAKTTALANRILQRFQTGSTLNVSRGTVSATPIPLGDATREGNSIVWPVKIGSSTASALLNVDAGALSAVIVNSTRTITPASAGRLGAGSFVLSFKRDIPIAADPIKTFITLVLDTFPGASGPPAPEGYYPGDNVAAPPNVAAMPTAPAPTADSGYQYAEIIKGSAVGVNNPWGFGGWSLTNGGNATQKCIIGESLNNTNSFRVLANIPASAKVANNPVSEVVGYPAIAFGMNVGFPNLNHPNLPIQYKDINVLWAGMKGLVDSGTNGVGQIAHDMRAMTSGAYVEGYSNAEKNIKTELFVITKIYGGYGAHPNGRDPARYRGTYSIGGRRYHFYIQPGASTFQGQPNPQIIWLPEVLPLPNIVDLAPIFKWGMRTRYSDLTNGPGSIIERGKTVNDFIIDPNQWFNQNAMGVEIIEGTFDVQLDTIFFRCNQDTYTPAT